MKIRLLKTKNGWVVTTSSHLSESDVQEWNVFESMAGVAHFLMVQAGETGRDKRGRFAPSVPDASKNS